MDAFGGPHLDSLSSRAPSSPVQRGAALDVFVREQALDLRLQLRRVLAPLIAIFQCVSAPIGGPTRNDLWSPAKSFAISGSVKPPTSYLSKFKFYGKEFEAIASEKFDRGEKGAL
jgi:hypothetical protein